jgi:hypothetical protein
MSSSKTTASAANPTPLVTLRKRLTKQDLHDLLIIWGRDQRIPSLKSRRQWALQRGLAPSTVSSWFYRRRARHMRLVGSAPTLTDPYDLNPSSPSNTIFEEPACGIQSPDVGSNGADMMLNSDDTMCSNPSLDSGETVVATTQPLTSSVFGHLEDGILSFANNLSGSSRAGRFLQRKKELESLSNRTGVVSSCIEKTLSPTPPCECVLCVSGALGIFLKLFTLDTNIDTAPSSPPTLWLPWSIYAECSLPAETSVWCLPPCSSGTALLDDIPKSEFDPQM